MARAFTSASSHKAQSDNAPASDVPLTIATFMRTASTGTSQACVSIGRRSTSAGSRYQLFFRNTNRIAGFCQNGGGTQITTFEDSSGVNISANTWYHGAVVFNTTTDRTVYRNGANSTNDTTAVTVGTVDTITLGSRYDGAGFGLYLNGQLAETAVWAAALTASEIESLAAGLSPMFVRPDALVFYAPLYGNDSPEPDWFGGYALTLTGTVKAAHPPVVYRQSSKIIIPAAAAGPTYTLGTDSGSFSLAGQDVLLPASRLLSLDNAAFALSGQQVDLLASRLIAADHAAFSLTGQDVDLSYTPSGATYTMTLDAGSFVLTGQGAGLIAARLLTADHGSFTLLGQEVDLQYGDQVTAVGRPKRPRPWAVEVDGQIEFFASAQAAVAWLSRENKRRKSSKPSKIEEKPEPIPFKAITFDGVSVADIDIKGRAALSRIKTMEAEQIALVEAHMAKVKRSNDDFMQLIGIVAKKWLT